MQESSKKVQKILLGVVILIVLVAAGGGIYLYNTPQNRLTRQLNLGQRYLEEQNYELAALVFEKAITIDDRCVEAYVGGVEAYLRDGEAEKAENLYGDALELVKNMSAEDFDDNLESVTTIYLYADEIYSDAPETAIEILEEGLQRTGEEKIEENIREDYIDLADDYIEETDYVDRLKIYDKVLDMELEGDLKGLTDCLKSYISYLKEVGEYDEIRLLAEKYGNKVSEIDFKEILKEIDKLELEQAVLDEKDRAEKEQLLAKKEDEFLQSISEEKEAESAAVEENLEKEQTVTAKDIINSASLTPTQSDSPVLNDLINQIFAQIFTEGMTTYDKVKACYDWLIMNTQYGHVGGVDIRDFIQGDFYILLEDYCAYEALLTHYGVCDNYSAAFVKMLRAIGLNCYVQGGMTHKAGGGYTPHAWVVAVINGTEYVFDPQVEDNIAKGGRIGYLRFCKTYDQVPDKYIK